MIYAEDPKQLGAFALGDLSGLKNSYRDVVGIDVDQMKVTSYSSDRDHDHAGVDAELILTRYNGERCTVRREKMHVELQKSIACKTQVICAPAVMTCKGCGASLDLLAGKYCEYCGRELDMTEYDWMIESIRL